MIIGVCGLGYTGSGAVIDLLKEYSGLQVEDKDEFGLVFRPDGLQDLCYQVTHPRRYMSSDMAIHRFIRLYRHTFRPRAGWGKDYSEQAEAYLDEPEETSHIYEKAVYDARNRNREAGDEGFDLHERRSRLCKIRQHRLSHTQRLPAWKHH